MDRPVCSVVVAAPDILSPLSLILESVLQADQQMMEKTKAKIFSALISVLQIQGLNSRKHDFILFIFLCILNKRFSDWFDFWIVN